jgi:hypothetical protein
LLSEQSQKWQCIQKNIFGSSSADADAHHSTSSQCYSQNAISILPDLKTHLEYFAHESIYCFAAQLSTIGVELNRQSLENLLDGATYSSLDGHWQELNEIRSGPLGLHINDSTTNSLNQTRCELQWYHNHCDQSNIKFQRSVIKGDQNDPTPLPLL